MTEYVSKKFRWILAVLFLGFTTHAARGESLAPEIARIAKNYSSLQASDALYDRMPRLHADFAPLREKLHRMDDPAQAAELRSLLRASDPKVRTLGIVLAFRECRLDVLPDIALLVDDPAQTFPHPRMTSEAFPAGQVPTDPTQVNQYATIAIRMYVPHSYELTKLDQTGKLPLSNGKALAEVMRAFAAKRDLRLSTTALLVAMDQATGGISPLQPDRILRIQRVLSELQQIAIPRRFFVADALDFDRYRLEQYSRDFLLDLARQVPREARWDAVMGKQPIVDPDLWPGAGSHYFLDHAADLFMTSDVDRLLKSAVTQPDSPNARCFIAAAELAPADADKILVPAFSHFTKAYQQDDRVRLATALARLGNDAGITAAVDWFFREPPAPGSYGFGREAFLDQLHAADPVRFRHVAARIIRDSRLTTLGPASTRTLILAAQGYLGRQLASDEDLQKSYGIDEAQRDTHFEPLKAWQESLKRTVDEWDR